MTEATVRCEMDVDGTINSRTSFFPPELRLLRQPSGVLGVKFNLPVVAGHAVVVGRGTVDFAIADEAVSRRHLRIHCIGEQQHQIEDTGSSGGTRINDQPLTGRKDLRHGDRIEIGSSELEYFLPTEHARRQLPPMQGAPVPVPPVPSPLPDPVDGPVPAPAPSPEPPPRPTPRPAPLPDPDDAESQGRGQSSRVGKTRERWLLWGAIGLAAAAATLLAWILVDTLG
jgi:hypothetical protein